MESDEQDQNYIPLSTFDSHTPLDTRRKRHCEEEQDDDLGAQGEGCRRVFCKGCCVEDSER